MNNNFKWRHNRGEVILWAVRWYWPELFAKVGDGRFLERSQSNRFHSQQL